MHGFCVALAVYDVVLIFTDVVHQEDRCCFAPAYTTGFSGRS